MTDDRQSDTQEHGGGATVIERVNPLLLYGALLVACLIVFPYLGMLLTLVIMSFVILCVIEKMPWLRSLIFSVLFILLAYTIFDVLLGITIPKGALMTSILGG